MLTTVEFHQHKVETVLTTPNDVHTGVPTTVHAVPVVEIPLITLTEFAPVDTCSNLFLVLLYFHCFS